MSDMRDDAREERKWREMKSAQLFWIAILIPSICSASPQSVTDLEATVQQRIGKRVEITAMRSRMRKSSVLFGRCCEEP